MVVRDCNTLGIIGRITGYSEKRLRPVLRSVIDTEEFHDLVSNPINNHVG